MIKAIYKTGSTLLLNNTRDKDLVFFYDDKEELKQAILNREGKEGFDVHHDFVKPRVFLFSYLYRFMELVEGEDLHLDKFSIFDHKDEYVKVLKRQCKMYKDNNKSWYHILTVVYMFENNSYELTQEQLENVQNVHDNGVSAELKEHILNFLNENEKKEDK